ncbi:class 1 fructose-bisphosphatase [Microvirga makkahensis]|uniref:Fructose-1,6-bisphosphatase class 1 n=2 Tax=Microvirga makkahensis TaxID=1128670 RepID=A0A7X3MTY5_9HYPH|nr:class 1 fructose-bisphosphatase [Microvirga makkahensis]
MPLFLEDYLAMSATRDGRLRPVAQTIAEMAKAAAVVQAAIASARIPQHAEANPDRVNATGDAQKALDVFADESFLAAAKASPVFCYGSEEQDAPVVLGKGSLALAIDPLDGSSNIDTNVSVGTIFSLLPALDEHREDPVRMYCQPGTRQLAAGIFIYGPQLLLVVTLGLGTKTFIYLPERAGFALLRTSASVPEDAAEYSINASNRRHWPAHVRRYIEDAEAGRDGPRRRNFGMRYVGSLVAETYRILQRGGVFLYPSDRRDGYGSGRLRQVYEANPIAFCIEQAGGAATNGTTRILDLVPETLHARTPLVFGSKGEVETFAGYIGKQTI